MELSRERLTVDSGSRFIGVTFLYMFIALLVTALVAVGVGFIFKTVMPIDAGSNPSKSPYFTVYMVTLIVSLIGLIITSVWFSISAIKGGKNLVVPFAIYAILMGILGSSFTMFVDPVTIGLAFGISCVAFGSMALIGFTAKRDMNFLGIVALGILTGVGILCLTNLIWMFVFPAMFRAVYWVIEGAIFIFCMLITIVDVYNIRKIAERGEDNKNLCMFCAFNLYIDFINIFLRVLRVLIAIRNN